MAWFVFARVLIVAAVAGLGLIYQPTFLVRHQLASGALVPLTLDHPPIELDGDVLAVIETISRDLTRQQKLDYGFEDVDREFRPRRRGRRPSRG